MRPGRSPNQDSQQALPPCQLLPNKSSDSINPLKSTFPQVLILNHLKSFRINNYTNTIGGPSHPFLPSQPAFTPKGTFSLERPTVFPRFLQVPYTVNSLFATLTKTAGVYPNSSHSGTPRISA